MILKSLAIAGAVAASVIAYSPSAWSQGKSLSAEDLESVRDSFIFVFDDTVGARDVASESNRMVREAGGARGFVYRNTIRGFSAKMPEHAAARMAANNPNIAYYEKDQIAYALVQGKPGGGGGAQPPQQTPWGITRVGGARSGATGAAWVIDSGIQQDHPDLNVDTARSANFVSKGKDTVEDGDGHGTHVAGTIAALDNDIGVVGVAPGALVVGVRVLDNRGSGTVSGVIAGVDYAAANFQPGDVANMSLGGGASTALDQAVENAASQGLIFALAAGNESSDANTKSPARVNHPNVWTVSASDSNDGFASFSNFGNPPIECAAPGVGVLSTYIGSDYRTLSGTSMASPHVAGLLLFGTPTLSGTVSGDPDGDPDQICVF